MFMPVPFLSTSRQVGLSMAQLLATWMSGKKQQALNQFKIQTPKFKMRGLYTI